MSEFVVFFYSLVESTHAQRHVLLCDLIQALGGDHAVLEVGGRWVEGEQELPTLLVSINIASSYTAALPFYGGCIYP